MKRHYDPGPPPNPVDDMRAEATTRDLTSVITLLIATLEVHAPGVGATTAMGIVSSEHIGDEAKDLVGQAAAAAPRMVEKMKLRRDRLWPDGRTH